MQSKATTVAQYLADLPEDRRATIEEVRAVILANLPEGYQESMNWGMISYEIPLERYPKTYNKKPLGYAALASQKNHMAVYLMNIYSSEESATSFEAQYRATGKRYDVGKSCVRFRTIDDLPLELIGRTIASTSVDQYIAGYEAARASQ
jgi:uncharacterized protein YdhG (YjbR/CyaY superfamily)